MNNVPVVSFTSEHLAVLTSWHDGMTKIGGTEEIDSAGGGVIKPTTMLDVIGGGSQDLLNLSDAGVTRVYVEEGGDVGIGTASPDANLDVEGVGPVIRVSAITDAAEEAELKLSWGSSDNHGLHLLYHANSAVSFIDTTYPTADASAFGDLAFRSWNGTTQIENMRIDGYTGNVGIGTSSPSSLLTTNTVAGTNEINLSGVVYVNSTSGSVGIGTTSPTDKLSIYDGRVNIREMTASSYA
ncbi:MAG: hypothetical protein HN745_18875, partial [Deltaproteobacteria bacterium]|nr:hypothetical protein [Deltaproteobacteria bacterium]